MNDNLRDSANDVQNSNDRRPACSVILELERIREALERLETALRDWLEARP